MQRAMYLVTGVSALLALSIACGRQNATPVSPSGSSGAAGDEVAGAAGQTLKVKASDPLSPPNGSTIDSTSPNLVATAVSTPGAFEYHFELWETGDVYLRGGVVGTPSWTATGLEFAKSYRWRVRASASYLGPDGKPVLGFGPWSAWGSFTTPDSRGYIRGNELFDPLTNGQTVGERHGALTFSPAGVKLESFLSYISYVLPQTLNEGEFSLIATGLTTSGPGDKTKVMAMAQDFGDIVTNERRMTVEKRNDGVVAWRFISHGDQVDTEGAEREFFNFRLARTYFFQATWRANRFGVIIREDGPNGNVVYNKSKPFKGRAYDPIPHVVYVGAPTGRSGDTAASVPFMTVRNVWVSSRPRPGFPGE